MYRLYTQIIYTIYTYLYIFTHHPTRSHTHTLHPLPRGAGGRLGAPLGRNQRRWACQAAMRFCICLFFLKAIASRGVLPLPKLKPLPQQHSEFFFKGRGFPLLCHVVPGDPDPSAWPREDSWRANPPSVPWGTPDGEKGPQQAESPTQLPPCTLARGYSVNGTCQMRRVLSVSPEGAGRPLPPEALPKLR